ncbi:hypothetical protein R1flu_013454 [Riccia fluitans]|uniref:Uncharacterized protein n=1 Tax=Riccia fluitans TaxID=41844 RepID=A0ABD1YDF2_9MARC
MDNEGRPCEAASGPRVPTLQTEQSENSHTDEQPHGRKVPAPPHIEFDPDPEELERMNRSMSRQLSVKQLARLSLKHSVSRRGTSGARRAQSMPAIATATAQEQETAKVRPEQRQEKRQSKIPDGPPPKLKFTPLELTRGGPSHSHKLSIIREAKAAEEERKKRAQEVAIRRSMRAQSALTTPNSTTLPTPRSNFATPRSAC